MATRKHTAPAEAFPLALVSYPPDRKVAVLKALQKATKGSSELTLEGAKQLIDGALPADVDHYDTEDARDEARKVLEEAGAVVSAPPLHPSLAEAPVSPSTGLIAKRLAAQQLRVYRVASIIDAVRGALPKDIPADQPDVIHALDEAKDILYQVADRLEGLHEPVTAEEQDVEASEDDSPVSVAPAEGQPSASFDKLLSRLLGLVHHFQLADQRLWNFNETPPEYQAAATVLHDATGALDTLYDELDSWRVQGVSGAVEALAAGAAEPSELPQALAAHLKEQQECVNELWSLLKRLDEDDDTPMCMGIAVRQAEQIADALDSVTLGKVLNGEGDAS